MCDFNPDDDLAFNLQQHQRWVKIFPNIKPYTGPFVQLDLTKTYYCPRCLDLNNPLVLNKEKNSLYCNKDYNYCEYEFKHLPERKQSLTFLEASYKLPLTEEDRQHRLNNSTLAGALRERLGEQLGNPEEHPTSLPLKTK